MSFLRQRLPFALCASLLGGGLLLATAPAGAFNILPALTGFSGGTLGGDPNFSGSLGYRFSLSRSHTVSALGFYDADEDGLNSTHGIGLFDASGTTLLASASVSAGTNSRLLNGFRWVSIADVSLVPGSDVIAATSPGDPTLFDPVLYETIVDVGIEGLLIDSASLSESGSGTVVAFPTLDEGLAQGFIGPNFAIAGTPGPLPLLGAASALVWSRRLRRRLGSASSLQS